MQKKQFCTWFLWNFEFCEKTKCVWKSLQRKANVRTEVDICAHFLCCLWPKLFFFWLKKKVKFFGTNQHKRLFLPSQPTQFTVKTIRNNNAVKTRTLTHTGTVVNHIYPDVDHTLGIELTVIHEVDYPANLLKSNFKDYQEKMFDLGTWHRKVVFFHHRS